MGFVTVTGAIRGDYTTTIDFKAANESCTFTVTTWRSNGLGRFLRLFHSHHEPRDANPFGSTEEIEGGQDTIVRATVEQKCNCVAYAVADIMKCLNKNGTKYRTSVLDYAVWYREHHKEQSTYSEYITLITYRCIVHHQFMVPIITWELVTLDGA